MKTESPRPPLPSAGRAKPRRLLKPGAWMAGIVVVATGLLSALDRPGAVGVARARTAPPTVEAAPASRLMPAFALNALLATLMDDDEPPRWTDVALHHFCGPATRVEVDGRPLVPGSYVPPTAFQVRWVMDECWPFDFAGPGLSGSAELQVFHDDNRLSAIVDARRLAVHGAAGTSLAGRFNGSLALAADEGVSR
jgi:hypothetical protein